MCALHVQTGYLTMDQARTLLPLLADDPNVSKLRLRVTHSFLVNSLTTVRNLARPAPCMHSDTPNESCQGMMQSPVRVCARVRACMHTLQVM